MTEAQVIQTEVAQALAYRADELRADARPLRAVFEDLALAVRTTLQSKGGADPVLTAALDLQYANENPAITVPLPLEIENAAVCLADPLPLDNQALRQALSAFQTIYTERYGDVDSDTAVQVVMLRVYGSNQDDATDVLCP